LRERKEDLEPLSEYFLRRYSLESKKHFTEITQAALEKLSAYNWPGNLRELANVIERAVVLGNGPAITIKDLPGRLVLSQPENDRRSISYRAAIDVARRDIVMRALTESRGNRAAAAKALGLHEKYFLRLLKTLGIN
jgi:DNA-binding NtrC family response regulator